jgi:hypothetical protein
MYDGIEGMRGAIRRTKNVEIINLLILHLLWMLILLRNMRL